MESFIPHSQVIICAAEMRWMWPHMQRTWQDFTMGRWIIAFIVLALEIR
jgi:hypothetical protein